MQPARKPAVSSLGKPQPDAPQRAVMFDDSLALWPEMYWLVDGVFPAKGLAMVVGDSGVGKSAFVLDLTGTLGRGADWRGIRSDFGGAWAWLIGEGFAGHKLRVRGFEAQFGIDLAAAGFRFSRTAINLASESDVDALIDALDAHYAGAGRTLCGVVIDNLSTFLEGSERDDAVMRRVTRNLQRVADELVCLVLLIHHTGKDSERGARGWSGLRAACDTEILLRRRGDRREAVVTKQKDGPEGLRFPFVLAEVDAGTNEHGESLRTVVVRHLAAEATTTRPAADGPDGPNESAVCTAARELGDAAAVDAVLDLAASRLPAKPGTRDRRRFRAERALRALVTRGVLGQREHEIFCTGGT